MQGGVKIYRGAAAAARHYLEADHSRVDDYYLAEGTGLAERLTASPEVGVCSLGMMDGDAYESWVAGIDPETGLRRGMVRQDAHAVRFVEVTVNGPKSWSLAAALHPDIAAAYDRAQDAAASQIVAWLAEHATTRVGPRDARVQVPVERIEAAVVRHYTSRAGDPHRHLHLQINARVWAEGKWRGLHTVGVRDSIDAMNGIGHAAVMTDPGFRQALAAHGLTVDPGTGEIHQLAPFTGEFSARAKQIGRNVARYEAEWRDAHHGQEPGPKLMRAWDARAWADGRPDKVIPKDGDELTDRWVEELYRLGYHDPEPAPAPTPFTRVAAVAARPGEVDRDAAVEVIVSRLGARRSGWNTADIRGEAEQLIARTGVVAETAVRLELAEDLTARTLAACLPLLPGQEAVPEHIRALTSPAVLEVEADLTTRLTARARPVPSVALPMVRQVAARTRLDADQLRVVAALADRAPLLVVEGAAGAGKTTTLALANTVLARQQHRLVIVTPTLKAAQVARREVGTHAFSAAWLIHQHGFRWDDNGHWTRLPTADRSPQPGAVLHRGDVLLVDEAGMLDQDTARALFTLADETGTRIALVGDRHQLPAVGRGGVLDLAARWADPTTVLTLDTVHRFADPEYAELSLAMRGIDPTNDRTGEHPGKPGERSGERRGEPGKRRGEVTTPGGQRVASRTQRLLSRQTRRGEQSGHRSGQVFDALCARDQIKLYPSENARTVALAAEAAATGALVMADTREQVALLNDAIRQHRIDNREVDDSRVVTTNGGERIGVGDRIATRRNSTGLGVANRDTWTVTGIQPDGTVVVAGEHGRRSLPAGYVREQVELAYVTTVYGAQGETTSQAHLALGEHTGAASAYVAMTRGRDNNTAHLVADTLEDARRQWVDTFSRDRADLGPSHAAALAAEEAAKYAGQLQRPSGLSLAERLQLAALRDTQGRHQQRPGPRLPIEPSAPPVPDEPWEIAEPGSRRRPEDITLHRSPGPDRGGPGIGR